MIGSPDYQVRVATRDQIDARAKKPPSAFPRMAIMTTLPERACDRDISSYVGREKRPMHSSNDHGRAFCFTQIHQIKIRLGRFPSPLRALSEGKGERRRASGKVDQLSFPSMRIIGVGMWSTPEDHEAVIAQVVI
jgi:hypothetical protein